MTEHTHQTTVAEARAKLAALRARVEAMPPSTVPPEALHEPTVWPLGCLRRGGCLCNEPHDECAFAIPVNGTVATVVDGCVVHGDAPLTPKGEDAMRQVIAAVRERIANG